MLSVVDVAERRGVSARRVRQLIHAGRIPAYRVGGRFVVADADAGIAGAVCRPMSQRMAWAFVHALSGARVEGLAAAEMTRIRRYLVRLAACENPAALLAAWLPKRAARIVFNATSDVLPALRSDPRVILSGVSDERSGLSSLSEVEAYIASDAVPEVVRDYLLLRAGQPNVFLHVSDASLSLPVPVGVVLADLAEHGGPRERGQVVALLRGLL